MGPCRTLVVALMAFVISLPSVCEAAGRKRKADEAPALFQVVVKGKRGFMDVKGQIVIQPAYNHAEDFAEGLAPVQPDKGGPYGYIDRTDKMVIEPKFTIAHGFSEGLAWVGMGGSLNPHNGQFRGGKYGVVDMKGRFVIAPSFEKLGTPFLRGISITEIPDRWTAFAFIDRRGRMLRKRKVDDICPLKDNMGRFSIRRWNVPPVGLPLMPIRSWLEYGFMDHTYTVVIPPKFGRASDFSEGLASARPVKGDLFGFINKRGQYVVKPRFRWAEPFSEGLAAVVLEEKEIGKDFAVPIRWGYVDRRLRPAFAPLTVCFAGRFRDGLAVLSLSGKKSAPSRKLMVLGPGKGFLLSQYEPHHMRVIDKQGGTVFEKKHCFIEPFRDGLAQVHDFSAGRASKVKIGYVDKAGKYVWEPRN